MTATSQHPVTPTVQQIEAWIAEAIELMATMDLNPKFPKMRKRWLSSVDRIAPARYRRSAKRPLIYDRKQGWEVATAQGEELDAAIRKVGAGVQSRAKNLHRRVSGITLGSITQTRQAIGLADPKALVDALSSNCPPPAAFLSEADYKTWTIQTLSHASTELKIDDEKSWYSGPNKMDQAPFEKYKAVVYLMEKELSQPSAWTMNEARLDRESRMKALSELRKMGGTFGPSIAPGNDSNGRPLTGKDNTEAMQAVRNTAQSFPTSWVQEASKETLDVWHGARSAWMAGELTPRSRGKTTPPYISLNGENYPAQGPMTALEGSALHEMGHHFEALYPEINQIARTHKAIRGTNQEGLLESLEIVPEGHHVGSSPDPKSPPRAMTRMRLGEQWYRPSAFPGPHTGLETTPDSSEVFSTGIAAALGGRDGSLSGHGGHEPDPRHLHLILGILATVGRH